MSRRSLAGLIVATLRSFLVGSGLLRTGFVRNVGVIEGISDPLKTFDGGGFGEVHMLSNLIEIDLQTQEG